MKMKKTETSIKLDPKTTILYTIQGKSLGHLHFANVFQRMVADVLLGRVCG